jgi:L-cysteine/cystine lyase
VAYLNTGTFGPLPRRTAEILAAWQRRFVEEGRSGHALFTEWLDLRGELRGAIARLIGAPRGSIALTTSTTEGCDAVVAGLRLRPGDEVVTTDVEHPGLLGALRAWELDVRIAAVRERRAADALAAFDEAITPKSRLIAVSHVAWTTGALLPVRELAEREIPLLVDGAQSAGAIPVDVDALGCDFYTVSGQKWLLGPEATGALYVRPDRIPELKMTFPSYASWEDVATLEPWPDARRYESVFTPAGATAGLLASMAFAEELGPERFERARAITERCRELLGDRVELVTEPGQATLVSFRPAEPADALVKRLEEVGVVVRDLPALGWVRASCGFWTSEEDLDRLVSAL